MFTSARSGLRDRSTGVAGRRREARRRLLRIKATEDARGVLRMRASPMAARSSVAP